MGKATLGERRVFSNLAYIRVTPWTSEASGPDGDTYDLTEVVADTTTVEQAENDSNVIEHEFSSSPLYENITLGDKTFTCESIDLQNNVLKGLFGWTAPKDSADLTIAPVAYKQLYATVELAFVNTEDIILLPKVLLNSRAVIASMKTDASRANINGTCYPAYIDTAETDMAVVAGAKDVDGTNLATLLARVKGAKA